MLLNPGGHCFVSAPIKEFGQQRSAALQRNDGGTEFKLAHRAQTSGSQSDWDSGNQTAIVFVTVNTHQRKSILAKRDVVEVLLKAWREADTWLVGRFVIMPGLIHFFCAPRDLSVSLKRWIKYWKSRVSLRWPRPVEQLVWQLDLWDTRLRRGENYDEKWDYVWRNPVRKGLVAKPEDWPYAGEITVLAWHDK